MKLKVWSEKIDKLGDKIENFFLSIPLNIIIIIFFSFFFVFFSISCLKHRQLIEFFFGIGSILLGYIISQIIKIISNKLPVLSRERSPIYSSIPLLLVFIYIFILDVFWEALMQGGPLFVITFSMNGFLIGAWCIPVLICGIENRKMKLKDQRNETQDHTLP